MIKILRILSIVATIAAAAGCSYKPLKAPCAPDDGGLSVAYSSLRADGPGPGPGMPGTATSIVPRDGCGPLKPI